MNHTEALAYLDAHTNLEGNRTGRFTAPLPTAGQVGGLSLDAMNELMAALGDPQNAYRTIHITGTNGKGSTARMVDAICRATELSVGLYTSPDLNSINERISWDGRTITDQEFADVVALIAAVEPLISRTPNRFELLTAAAFVWFAEMGTEVAVVEVGMLGRYDATNVVDADVAVITNIGKDHTDGGPGWRDKIAQEKSGIIKPDSWVVLGSDLGDQRMILEAEPNSGLWVYGRDFDVEENRLAVGGRVIEVVTPNQRYEDLFLPFHGRHQGDNAATAIAATEAFFGRGLDQEVVEAALAELRLPGRFEVIDHDPLLIVDGAHNPHGAEAARVTLDEEFARIGSRVLVFAMLNGKSPVEMLRALGADDFDAVICTQTDWSRAVPAKELALAALELGIDAEVIPDPMQALARARAVTADDDLILVTGSLYLVGEIRAAALASDR